MTYSFEWAKGNVSDELSAGGGHGETDGLVLGGVVLTDGVLVDIFEDLVETELAEALGTVADESWDPTLNKRSVTDSNSKSRGAGTMAGRACTGENRPNSRAVVPTFAFNGVSTYVGVALDTLLSLEDLEALGDGWVQLWVGLTKTIKRGGGGLTCLRHLTISSGQMAAWVRPQAKIPPTIHLA